MKLRYTPDARADLREIAFHYREINLSLAKRMVHLLQVRCRRLSRFPFAGQRLDPARYRDVRRAVVPPYLIVYRVKDRALEVIRIVHGARDLSEVLSADPPISEE